MRLKPSMMRPLLALPLLLSLTGCGEGTYRLFHPFNRIAGVQLWATIFEFGIMCLIIVPVTVMIAWFLWRYRKSANAAYDPNWSHSLVLEILVWGVPLAIVTVCGVISFHTTNAVNPYDPGVLAKAEAARPPLDVDVIATDWQWLFIYPQQHIAAVDELVAPQGRIMHLRLTSTSVTNDFFVPQMAPMIDVMPGMRTEDTFDTPKPGDFTGFSADFSGAGFSWMQFALRVVSPADFKAWVARAASSPRQLSYEAFTKFARPTVDEGAKPYYFANPAPHLFDEVVDAARAGVIYRVPGSTTRRVADLDDETTASTK